MLTPKELRSLWNDLAHTKVLSVYLDTRVTDPAMRDAWRPALLSAVRAAGASVTDAAERERFERAAAFVRDPATPPGGMWGAPGWVAFATEDGVRYATDLPVQPTPLVEWGEGPVIAPYMRALKQRHPVIVAVVESRSARLYRYALGRLETLAQLEAPGEEPSGAGAPAAAPRGSSYPAARGAPDTEVAARRRTAAFQRLATALADRLETLAGDTGWVLIGGTSEWAHHAREALGRQLEGRVLVSPTLHHGATDAEIVREAKDAATELRAARGRVIVERLLDQAGAHTRAEVGLDAVRRALRASAVDLLLVSQEFLRTHERDAESAVRAAIEQGATVEVPSGDASETLDRAAAGIAARLRFPVSEWAAANGAGTAASDATSPEPAPPARAPAATAPATR